MRLGPKSFSATSAFQALPVCTTLLLVAVLILGTSRGHAQAAPGVYADAHNPSGTPVPQDLDAVWDVDHLTGALSVKIPFPTGPAGGRGPHIPFSLLYNSSSTVTLQQTDVYNTNTTTDAYTGSSTILDFGWIPGSYNAATSPTGPWSTTGPFLTANVNTIPDYTPVYANGYIGPIQGNTVQGCQISGPYLYSDENGATHDMNIAYVDGIGANPNSECQRYQNSPTNGYIDDGLSIRTTIPGIGPHIGITTNAPPLIYPNGTQYLGGATFWQQGKLEDANGNIASLTQDSAGRPAFTTNFPIAAVGGISPGTYTVKTRDANGNNETYTITVSLIPIGGYAPPHPTDSELSNLNPTGTPGSVTGHVQAMSPSNTTAVTSISLPDGTSSYNFTYDPAYGTIQKITFPTGGYVRFTWGLRGDCGGYGSFNSISCVVVTDSYLSSGSGENHWIYSFPSYVSGSNQLTSKISDPDGYTKYVGQGFTTSIIFPQGAPAFREISRNRYDNSDHLLESVYGDTPPLPGQIVTTVYDGSTPLQRQVQIKYDTHANIIEKDESDYYACSGSPCAVASSPPNGWLRKTLINYLWNNPNSTQPSYPYVQAFIVDKPSQITVTDGAGSPLSMVQYNYDEFPLSGSAGILNHDDANYPSSMVGPRGNLTTEKHCVTVVSNSCTAWISKSTTYDLTGMPISFTDYKGNPTTYSYNDAYVSGGPSASTNAYPTTITTVSSPYSDSYTYNYYTGSVATHKDWNGNTTTYAYNDPLNRPTAITYPATIDGTTGSTGIPVISFKYTDSAAGWAVKKTVSQRASVQESTTTTFDGLARPITTIAPNNAETDTVYDSLGRVQSVSNPYLSTTEPTYGLTTFHYDALGRKLMQCQPDNGTGSAACTAGNSYLQWTYSGNATSTKDENGNWWTRVSDGLGRLTSVVEPGSLLTTYSYDSLGNLKCADQWGTGTVGTLCSSSKLRTFSYDSLSRLISSQNPETGPIIYAYLSNGQLCAGDMMLPCSKTDNRGVNTVYSYDSLNRLLSKSYTNDPSSSPFSCYEYGTTISGPAASNLIGRLVNSWTQKTACQASPSTTSATRGSFLVYDPMGRVKKSLRCVRSNCTSGVQFSVDQNYDLAGNLTQWTDGLNRDQFTLTYDSAGRPQSLNSLWVDASHPATLFSVQGYSPAGGFLNWMLGPNLNLTRTYDSRLRVSSHAVTKP